jgi:hypothetical protein
MTLNRNIFLDDLVKDSVNLKILFMNHSGAPNKLHSDLPSIDLLTDTKGVKTFIEYSKSHSLTNELVLKPCHYHSEILVSFKDGSQLNFYLLNKFVNKSLDCLPVKDVFRNALVNDFGMLVPACSHHFEYILNKYQFDKTEFPDKFQKYFSALDASDRTSVFRYIQPKYNLVFNVIEDLYIPKGGVLLKLTIGLRRLSTNTLPRMAYRALILGFWKVSHLFRKQSVIYGVGGNSESSKKSNSPIERKSNYSF